VIRVQQNEYLVVIVLARATPPLLVMSTPA
jgi:hypothetical protein